MPLLVLLSGSTTSQPDYSLPNLVLMAIYVGLTLVLAFVAVVSIVISSTLSRNALAASDRQSREAIAAVQRQIEASERQSKEAIEAVNKQIETSERQSKEAIEAVNRQIEAGERQAQEALYNQHKPVVVPISEQISGWEGTYTVNLQNKGAGVALNAFGVMGIKGLRAILCSAKIWFLVPDNEEPFYFKVPEEFMFPFNVFEEVNIFPQVGARLMVTYNDAFSNKYFAVFDYSEELGWKQVHEIKRVKQRLDELLLIRHKTE